MGLATNVRCASRDRPGPRQLPVGGERHGLEAGALDLGQGAVEQVARRRRHDQAALGHEGAGEDGEDVVGAVADQDAVGIDAEDAAGGLAEGGAGRVGVLAQAVAGQARSRARSNTRGEGG